jgi:hypothetical protein
LNSCLRKLNFFLLIGIDLSICWVISYQAGLLYPVIAFW